MGIRLMSCGLHFNTDRICWYSEKLNPIYFLETLFYSLAELKSSVVLRCTLLAYSMVDHQSQIGITLKDLNR